LLVAFLLVNAPNCHLSLVFSSVVQGSQLQHSSLSNHLFKSHLSHGFAAAGILYYWKCSNVMRILNHTF